MLPTPARVVLGAAAGAGLGLVSVVFSAEKAQAEQAAVYPFYIVGPDELCALIRRRDLPRLELCASRDPNFDLNVSDGAGDTPLMAAILHADEEMVRFLLEQGADPDHLVTAQAGVQRAEFTPLAFAAGRGHAPAARALVEFGANVQAAKDCLRAARLDPAVLDRMGLAMPHEDVIASNRRLAQKSVRTRLAKRTPVEQLLRGAIIGQEGAIRAVSDALVRYQTGWVDGEHPLVLMFLGSSGVGKTETAKTIARHLGGSAKDGFVRIDMSEYQERHSTARLIGAPPGYVGYDKGGQLTEALKKRGNSVVLFDEIEKAHPEVLTLMLQLFDEGRLTDGQGHTITAKDAVFVCTSNLAQGLIADSALELREQAKAADKDADAASSVMPREWVFNSLMPVLKSHFGRDEFLGRIDEFVVFLPFTEKELSQLVDVTLEKWVRHAKSRHQVEIKWNTDLVNLILDDYNLRWGARSLQHTVDKKVINPIARFMQHRDVPERSALLLEVDKDKNVVPRVTASTVDWGNLSSGSDKRIDNWFSRHFRN